MSVAILMATRNGGKFLADQLESIRRQTRGDWRIYASDDGSDDGTLGFLRRFQRRQPNRIKLIQDGPQGGFAANFLSLINSAPLVSEYTGFADQDDYWLPTKLERAVARLAEIPDDMPALYGARVMNCDANLAPIGTSPHYKRRPSFQNALVQNFAGGNTMVMNRAATELLRQSLPFAQGIIFHDWWAYQIISGAGGVIIYDSEPQLLYRQHARNIVGSNNSPRDKLRRVARVLSGTHQQINQRHLAGLERARVLLTLQNQARLGDMLECRQDRLRSRLRGLARAQVYRQTRLGTCSLWAAATLRLL